MQANSTTTTRTNKGQFQKGNDPRRHKFTTAECQAGFWAAIDSVASRYPDAVDRSGRHMTTKFLPAVISRKQARF
ncbi:MAG: hypothetical protein JO316_15535 [Abitibacteriaceae bacterium]|nr:hypothetical protein [Abditibacteriaceae bacterium]